MLTIAFNILNQPHPLQTRMAVLADDDVVVHGNPERGGDIDDGLGHLDVGLRRRRIAAGMVVHNGRSSHNHLISLDLSEVVHYWGREVGHVVGADS